MGGSMVEIHPGLLTKPVSNPVIMIEMVEEMPIKNHTWSN